MNVICSLFLFFPLMLVMFRLAFTWAVRAVTIKEVFFNSFWYPRHGPTGQCSPWGSSSFCSRRQRTL